MHFDRRHFLRVAAASALPVVPRVARAQTYPTRQITLVVPFAAGGIADAVARLTAPKLSERLGQAVIVENRAGAGGNLGARMVAGSAADGYTLLATTSALAVNDSASRNKGYATEDLRAVAIVADSPDILAVHPRNPAKSLPEFIAAAREKSFTFASAGTGTGPHIGAEYFFREIAKVKALHVPFGGGAPAVTAAVGNHVDAVWIVLPTVTPHVAQGSLRGLGLASRTRNPAVPDVPTLARDGLPRLLHRVVGRLLRAGANARCGGDRAQHRDQRHPGPSRGAGTVQDAGLRPRHRGCPHRRGTIPPRPCRLGQDGPRRRYHRGLMQAACARGCRSQHPRAGGPPAN